MSKLPYYIKFAPSIKGYLSRPCKGYNFLYVCRRVPKASGASTETESKKEDTPHIYDELNIFPAKCSEATADSRSMKCSKYEVPFDTADPYIHMHPVYLELTADVKPTHNA